MAKINDGGPAFPVMHSIDGNWQKEPIEKFMGLSLRDWFAGQVLPTIAERYSRGEIKDWEWQSDIKGSGVRHEQIISLLAYRQADAMLSTRKNMEKGES